MIPPTPEQVTMYAKTIGFELDGEKFCDYYEMRGWTVGKQPIKSWQAAVRTWKRFENERSKNTNELNKLSNTFGNGL